MALMFAVPLILYMNEFDPKPPTQDICNIFSHMLVVHQTSACLDTSCNSYVMSYDLFKSQYIVEKYLIFEVSSHTLLIVLAFLEPELMVNTAILVCFFF
jgi:hypothetical protein